MWLPLGGDAEAAWPSELKIFLYLLGLFYCFLGVAIIADVFMSAIEKVTSAPSPADFACVHLLLRGEEADLEQGAQQESDREGLENG